ncbi:MAG: hypothetical protein JSU94_04660 [Phycisphaerales bacterium]|nr:MAG: hypothetical protein JSU94_04660 [Phycisphaerales bacterium]
MMAPAAERLARVLADTPIADPADTAVIRNIDAQYYRTADDIRTGLTKQLTQPIYWQKCAERLLADGVQTLYEIGPGRTLTGLIKRINRKINTITINSAQTINTLIGFV